MLKLLTLNLHCLEETKLDRNKKIIVDEIIKKDIDIIFLQEVAQYHENQLIMGTIKESNYGYDLQQLLLEKGIQYHYDYVPIKHSFGKYDEGLGVLSKYRFDTTKAQHISKSIDYYNWKSRKVQSAVIHQGKTKIAILNTHFGWTDEFERFEDQVDELLKILPTDLTIIAGDFNVSPISKEYQYLQSKNLHDLFYNNDEEYKYISTHVNDMDFHTGENRIDYFFSNKKIEVVDREILFTDPLVSDHYGVYICIKI